MKNFINVGLALAILLLLVFPASEAAIQCSDVTKDLAPCTSYLKGNTAKPSAGCCSGVSKLNSAASTTADKRAACGCLKSASKKMNPSSSAANALPSSCGISLPYTFSSSIDCSKIS